jgi:tetratricopeptide (TPR) repeat protein
MAVACAAMALCPALASEEKPADLLASGFAGVHALRPDTAIHCFTPLLIHAASKKLKEGSNAELTARYMLLIGRCFTFDQNFPAAVSALTIAHRLDPSNQSATVYLADNLIRNGEDTQAQALLADVKKLTPGNVIADTLLAAVKFRAGEYKEGLHFAQLGVNQKAGKTNWVAHHLLARCYARYGYKKESLDQLLIAAKLAPTPYYREILLATADAWQRKALSDSSVQREHLRAAGKIAPYDPLWSSILADDLGQKKESNKEAAQLYSQSVNCRRLDYKAFSSYAGHLRTTKQLASAWRVSQYITAMMPTYYECYVLQHGILEAQEKHAEAVRALEKAVQLAPRVVSVTLQLAGVYWKANEHDRAFSLLNKSLQLMPESAGLWQKLAEYQLETKQWQQAKTSFEKALSLLPPTVDGKRLNIVAAYDLGRVCAGLGTIAYHNNDGAEALRQAQAWNELKFVPELPGWLSIIQLRPGHLDTSKLLAKEKEAAQHAELGDMLLQNHQIADSIKEYKLAANLNPDDVDYHEYLLNAMTEQGNWLGAASEDWAVSNKLLGKVPHAIGEMGKKKQN